MSGAQITLNAHGACASVIRPTTRMSTPMSRIQSGMAYQTSPSGSPDENDSSDTAMVRFDRRAWARTVNDSRIFDRRAYLSVEDRPVATPRCARPPAAMYAP